MSKEKKGDIYNKMNFIERSQLDRLNQITNILQREIQNRDNYMASMNNQRNLYSNDIIKQQTPNELDKLPDYETLQNMYLQHLSSNISPDYQNNQINTNTNFPIEKNMNSGNYHNYGNPQSMQNERPFSNADNKKKQQEEYRTVLLNQMREQNERKQKEKFESRGYDIVNKRPISTNSVNTNSQVSNIPSFVNNLSTTNTNTSSNPYQHSYSSNIPVYPQNYNNNNKNYSVNNINNDPQINYLTKQQFENINGLIKQPTINSQNNSNNYHVSNIPNTKQQEVLDYPSNNIPSQKMASANPQIDEKQAEKQKKMEYQNILKKQMEERKERLEGEKKKRLEEEKRIEEQYRVMIEKEKEKEKEQENQKKMKQNMMEAHNHQTNNTTKQNNQFNQTNANLQTSQNTQQNNNFHNNKNIPIGNSNVNPSITQEYLNYKDKQIFNQTNDNQDYHNHPHFENNPYENFVDQYSEQRDFNQKPNYHTNQTFNKFPQQSLNNFNLSNYPPNPNYLDYVPPELVNTQNFNPMFNNTQNNFAMKSQSNQLMIPSFVDEMCRQFWGEQMKLINQYQQNVYEVMKERDNAIKESLLMRERMLLNNQLQMEQEKIKKSVGYMPFDTNTYYQNLEEMFNNPKLTASNLNHNNYNQTNYSQKTNNYNHPQSSSSLRKYNNLPEEKTYKTKSTSPVKNTGKNIALNYDELVDNSVIEQSGNYQCLDGVSKLVKIFPKTKMDENDENEQFYETWRDDDTLNNISKLILNKQNNIAENMKNSEIKPQHSSTTKKANSSLNNSVNSKKTPVPNTLLYTNEPPQKDSSIVNRSSNVEKPEKVEKSKLSLNNTERSQIIVKKSERINNKNINDKNTSLVVNRDRSEIIVNSEENYEASFEVIEENISGDQGKKEEENEQPKEEINLEEYKEIRENDNEKFKTKVNFFESDGNLLNPVVNLTNKNHNNLAETINNNRESAQEKMEKYSIIRKDNYNEEEDSHFIEHDDLDELENNDKIINTQAIGTLSHKNQGSNQYFDSHFLTSNNNLPNKENDFKVIYNKPDPKERVPREISSNNIDKMNSLYEKYNQMKKTVEKPKDASNINYLDETYTNKNINNVNNLEDSIRKFRPFTANAKDQIDFNNSKLVQNGPNITSMNKIENKKFVYVPSGTDLNSSQNFANNTIISNANYNDITKCQKINPINDLNNEDSYIKDLTKLRKYALNEIESADLSYVKNKESILQEQRNENSFIIEYNRKETNSYNQLKKSSIESNRYQNISNNK